MPMGTRGGRKKIFPIGVANTWSKKTIQFRLGQKLVSEDEDSIPLTQAETTSLPNVTGFENVHKPNT